MIYLKNNYFVKKTLFHRIQKFLTYVKKINTSDCYKNSNVASYKKTFSKNLRSYTIFGALLLHEKRFTYVKKHTIAKHSFYSESKNYLGINMHASNVIKCSCLFHE